MKPRELELAQRASLDEKAPIAEPWRTQILKPLLEEEKLKKKDFLNRKEDYEKRVMIQRGREKTISKLNKMRTE